MESNNFKERILLIFDSFGYTAFITIFILFSVFGWDISEAWLSKSLDRWIELGMFITLCVFTVELIFMIYALPLWWKNITVWLCLLATLAMIFEIPRLTQTLFGITMTTGTGIINLRLHKIFRMLARIGRLLRILKTLLLSKFRLMFSQGIKKADREESLLKAKIARKQIEKSLKGKMWDKLENTTSLTVMGVFGILYIITIIFLGSLPRPDYEEKALTVLMNNGSLETPGTAEYLSEEFPDILYLSANNRIIINNEEKLRTLRDNEIIILQNDLWEMRINSREYLQIQARRYIVITLILIFSVGLIVVFINWAITRFSIEFSGTLKSLALGLDERDPYTRQHSEHVALYARKTAKEMGMSREDQQIISIAGDLHDIGKIGLSETILFKEGKLTPGETAVMQNHPEKGASILDPLTDFDSVILTVRHHHERYNGKGYPDGLKGDSIPKMAKILAVCDVWDAVTTDRPYRTAMSLDEAKKVLEDGKGSDFDPEVVEAFFRALEKIDS